MKLKIIFTVMLLGVFSVQYSQDKVEGFDVVHKKIIDSRGLVGALNSCTLDIYEFNGLYYAFSHVSSLKKSVIVVKKLDKDLNVLDSVKLELAESYYTQDLYKLENGVAISYLERVGEMYNLKVKKFNFESFNMDKNEIFVSELNRKRISLWNPISMDVSDNGKYFSISKTHIKRSDKRSSEFYVYNYNMELEYSKSLSKESLLRYGKNTGFSGFKVTDNGSVSGIFMSLAGGMFSRTKASGIMTVNKNEIRFSNQIEDLFDGQFSFTYLDKEFISPSPSWTVYLPLRKIDKVIWFGVSNVSSKRVVIKSFTSNVNFKKIIINEIDITPIILKFHKTSKVKHYYFLKSLKTNNEGNIILNIENYKGGSGRNSGADKEIIVIKLNSKTEVIWSSVIRKKQYIPILLDDELGSEASRRLSFAFFIKTNGDLCYVFNSNRNNHPGLLSNKKSPIDGTIVLVVLDSKSGEIKDEKIIQVGESFKLKLKTNRIKWLTKEFKNFGNDFLIGDSESYILYKEK